METLRRRLYAILVWYSWDVCAQSTVLGCVLFQAAGVFFTPSLFFGEVAQRKVHALFSRIVVFLAPKKSEPGIFSLYCPIRSGQRKISKKRCDFYLFWVTFLYHKKWPKRQKKNTTDIISHPVHVHYGLVLMLSSWRGVYMSRGCRLQQQRQL